MDKLSLPVKIVLSILIVMLSIAALIFLVKMCSVQGSGLGAGLVASGYFLVYVFFIFALAFILSRVFAAMFGAKAAKSVFYPKITSEAPPELSLQRAKIANGDYASAISDLEEMFNNTPDDFYIADLLTNILIDKVREHSRGAEILELYLEKEYRIPEDVGIVMKISDIYLDSNREDEAIKLLTSEINGRFKGKDVSPLVERLEALREGKVYD